ncbi:hypothetical protein ACER0C_001126 [Sarotherodon galilaeus]
MQSYGTLTSEEILDGTHHQKGCRPLLYCLLVGTFPFNSFLSGFISCVGSFILAGDFLSISPERAFVDFLFAHTVLHLVVMNLIG